ncbi:MAG: hypothetical protein ACFFDW_02850 [Candidatus Thorarchaeota archaeon]
MKRSIIVVLVFSIGFLVILSFVGVILLQNNQQTTVFFRGSMITLEYDINFNYCKSNPEARSHISIEVIGDKIYFEQICIIYCSAYDENFWLELESNLIGIKILEIFDDDCVTSCCCPIKITGCLGDFYHQSLTLEFVDINNYINEIQTIKSFQIKI